MKKVFRMITATLAVLSIFAFAGAYTVTAQAAGEYKNAVYEGGVYANNGKTSFAVLFYKNGNNEIVYLNDGNNYVYTEYTLTDAEVPGYGAGAKLTAGQMVIYTFEQNGQDYIMTGDGVLYLSEDLTAYEAQQIRDAF